MRNVSRMAAEAIDEAIANGGDPGEIGRQSWREWRDRRERHQAQHENQRLPDEANLMSQVHPVASSFCADRVRRRDVRPRRRSR